MAEPVDHPRLGATHMVASPLNLEGLAAPIRAVAPLTPEHTDAVLGELGYSRSEIEALRTASVI